MTGGRRSLLLGLATALVLADSSVVTLALPDILRRYDVSITTVAWVLTAFNLTLAIAAVPAALLAHRRPTVVGTSGLLVFSAGSLACGLAPSFGVLVIGRCVQAVGGAAAVAAALDLLATTHGSEERAGHVWARAGVLGAAAGPAVGGVLTQLLGWASIFLCQAPLALAPLVALRGAGRAVSTRAPAGRPDVRGNVALLLASAGLSAALFLLVILLVDGWTVEPAFAGAVLTVMPLTAIAIGRLPRSRGGSRRLVGAGLVLVAGGLAALGLLPHAGWPWTLPPQVLVGAGLGLTVSAITAHALRGRTAQAVHGGWTIASRHAGVVLGLLVLTPLFTVALHRNETAATRAGAAVVLDSRIPPLEKLRVAQDVLRAIDRANGRLPDVEAVFANRGDESSRTELRRVARRLEDQLERAVTSAFSLPFLVAAGFALAALGVILLGPRAVTL